MASHNQHINEAWTTPIERNTVRDCVVSKPDEENEDICLATSGSRFFECKGNDYHATSIIVCALNETSAKEFLNNTDFQLWSDEGAIVECDLDMKLIVLNDYDGYEYYEFSDKEKSDSKPMHTEVFVING